MKHIFAAAASVVGLLLVGASTAVAQHHGGHVGGHRGGHVPVHHGSNYGHGNWNYVVPHHSTHIGAYYTTGQTHYYTPSPVIRLGPAIAHPPVAVEVHKPVELAFGGFSRYEDLAGRLVTEANALCLDLHHNYRHNRNFAEVYREAYGVLQAAKYVHGDEHRGDREAINRRLVEVDKQFHHVQDELRGWTRAATRPIGAGALPEKVAGVEAVLHHLCYDVGVKPHEAPAEAPPPPVEEAPPPPAPSVGKP